MRPIRFRAYNRKLGLMREVAEVRLPYFLNGQVLSGKVVVWDHPSYESAIIKGLTDMWDIEDCELIQNIGLKDLNGVEIYEGDILDYGNTQVAIMWYEYGAKFVNVEFEVGQETELDFSKPPKDHTECVVVGNLCKDGDFEGVYNLLNSIKK